MCMRRAASGESAACCEQASIIDTDRLSGQEERRGQARRQPTDSCRTARGSGMPPAGSARQGVNGGRDGRIRHRMSGGNPTCGDVRRRACCCKEGRKAGCRPKCGGRACSCGPAGGPPPDKRRAGLLLQGGPPSGMRRLGLRLQGGLCPPQRIL